MVYIMPLLVVQAPCWTGQNSEENDDMAMAPGTDAQRTTTGRTDNRTAVSTQENIAARAVGVISLIVIALIHANDAGSKYAAADARYVFWLYIALILGCAVGAGMLILRNLQAVWAFTALLGAAPFVSYVISRTTGLPRATDDIGNWGEPLGVAGLIVEVLIVALSLMQLSRMRREHAA